jgi:hypothetical protein
MPLPTPFAALFAALILGAPVFVAPALAASLDGVPVTVVNESEPVLCAEKDNVALSFASDAVRAFRIEAAHPVYLAPGIRDNWEADWSACDMSGDPVFATVAPPGRETLYEQPDMWVIGWRYASFWRPATAKVRIGDKVFEGLTLLQVWQLRSDGAEEVLVFYPQDGYWRARPLAPRPMRNTAYGSSFLVGPVEMEGRPIVAIDEVVFDPAKRQFSLDFTRGGTGTLTMVNVDENRIALDVVFDTAITGAPFAMLRSMYVTEFNNDAARIAVRETGASGWREAPIMGFDKATATDIWVGRLTPSQHNKSSPDFIFNSFSDGPTPKRPKNEPPVTPQIIP